MPRHTRSPRSTNKFAFLHDDTVKEGHYQAEIVERNVAPEKSKRTQCLGWASLGPTYLPLRTAGNSLSMSGFDDCDISIDEMFLLN